ncbi:transcription antitermination protein NusB [Odoribacter sp. OttesenSCG-928-J03]|nr:transcription antitermination protein NusB [Odoribacter sp. OttesenSCG-928-J03]MDL2330667.1 transcription antitermination protein NusB [Odoribacter sp. OttesenSCG-928-A06]
MTSRRLIRTKVLHILYSYIKKEKITLAEIERDLLKSIDKSTDLYYLIFLLLTEIQHKSFLKIDTGKNKYFATEQELNPNLRFMENPIFAIIGNNKKFKTTVKNYALSWADYPEIIDNIYKEMIKSEAYEAYMNKSRVTFEDHKQVIMQIFVNNIVQNELFIQILEDKNIFWNDDLALVFELVYKTLKNLPSEANEDSNIFMQIYKNDEDIDFAKTLLHKSIFDFNAHIEIINQFTQNWEIERLAEMDKLIMIIAISELKYFPSIPVKVTLDEYIEISKSYCSPKSGSFINGVLDKAVVYLKEKGLINKMGRGLME